MRKSREEKRAEIIEAMVQFKDEFGNIDTTKLRKEMPKVYGQISYYFDSIDEALIACNASNSVQAKEAAKGAPVNRKTLRNELAYDMLNLLRGNFTTEQILERFKNKHTLEQIADNYGVSRAHVNQLFQSLEKSVGATRDEEAVQQSNDEVAE